MSIFHKKQDAAPDASAAPAAPGPRKRWKPGKLVLTYRTKRRLRGLGITLASLAVALCLGLISWFFWLNRFVVYSADGAHLDFAGSFQAGEGVEAEPPETPTVLIHYNEGEEVLDTSNELTKFSGFYVTVDMLRDSVSEVRETLQNLPDGAGLMLDLKSIYGNFYYTSGIPGAPLTDQVDLTAVDELIDTLTNSGLYLIARVPAFRDYSFGVENTQYGLESTSEDGDYLWADDENCYWLNPTSTGTMSYLISIATELRNLGFDEVVFTDFAFPNTDQVRFDGDRAAAIRSAADTLVASCTTDTFAVSFQSSDRSFALPEGRTRLYLTDVDASKAQGVFNSCTFPQREVQLVFLTEIHDTRFNISSVLRPLPVGDLLPEPSDPALPEE